MANEADQLASKLENYVLQLRQVEAALEVDPTHVELLKIKADLNELIDLTRKILSEKIDEGASCSKRAKLSADAATTSASATRDETASSNLLDSDDAVSSPSSPEDTEATETCNTVIECGMKEILPDLEKSQINLKAEDLEYCVMLNYWRKTLAEMRRPDSLNRVLPITTMANLSTLRNVSEEKVKSIMELDKCINPYNNDQLRIIVNILNEGRSTFKKMVTSFCNRCAGRGHIAKICTRLKNKQAVNEYYKKNHPEMIAYQQKRRKMNSLRNKRLRAANAAADNGEK